MTSPKNSSVNVLHPLQIPELVNAICSLLDIKSCAKLLFLSRHIYAIVLPIVWKDAEMESLFRLIPGTKVEDHDTSHPTGCNYAIHFPATRELTRFTIHAPFVKTLRASRPYAVNFPSQWPSSGPDAASNPLLPNLQRLVITTFDTIIAAWSVDWIPRLLYPGLLGLEMFTVQPSGDESESYAWLDKNTYFNLASQVSRACPRIETLRLFPEDIVLLPKKDAIKIYNQIADFRYLRSLAFSGTVVHEKLLEVLGRLPHLETLSLCSDFADNKEFDEIPLSVPNDSFPSLRHLYLYALYETTMSSVCKIPPLFSRPVKTIILFEDQYSDDDMGDDERSDVAVTCLGRNSPQLQELTILPRGNNGLFIITRHILDAFKCMPLRYLRLGEVVFNGYSVEEADDESADNRSDRPEIKWRDILASVPQLEELGLERQELSPQLLRLIALRLPNLRLLIFGNLDLGSIRAPSKTNSVAAQPIALRGHSYFWSQTSDLHDEYNPPNEETIYNAAKYILSIWPNVTACETHKTPSETGSTESEPDEATAAKLYAAIRSLKAEANDD